MPRLGRFGTKKGDRIDWALKEHLSQIIAIARDGMGEGLDYERAFRNIMRSKTGMGLVACRNGKVAGFAFYQYGKNDVLIHFLAVGANHRRIGVGEALIGRLKEKIDPQRRRYLFVFVRETALSGQLFLRSAGFRATEIIKDFFTYPTEDGYLMEFDVAPDVASWHNRISDCSESF